MPFIVPRAARRLLAAAATALPLAACAAAPTPVSVGPGGFALYRSGQLSETELADLCRLGVEEMVVLDGGATRRECAMRDRACPGLRVRYDAAQDAHEPLTVEFLSAFDTWIAEARADGRKVALRCRHGWHRAGRLSAWYRMRFEGATADEAVTEMLDAGRFMRRHRQLVPQLHAMADLLEGRPCSTRAEHCVAGGPPAAGPTFDRDVCP